jgi:hypothetical protein
MLAIGLGFATMEGLSAVCSSSLPMMERARMALWRTLLATTVHLTCCVLTGIGIIKDSLRRPRGAGFTSLTHYTWGGEVANSANGNGCGCRSSSSGGSNSSSEGECSGNCNCDSSGSGGKGSSICGESGGTSGSSGDGSLGLSDNGSISVSSSDSRGDDNNVSATESGGGGVGTRRRYSGGKGIGSSASPNAMCGFDRGCTRSSVLRILLPAIVIHGAYDLMTFLVSHYLPIGSWSTQHGAQWILLYGACVCTVAYVTVRVAASSVPFRQLHENPDWEGLPIHRISMASDTTTSSLTSSLVGGWRRAYQRSGPRSFYRMEPASSSVSNRFAHKYLV